MSLSKPSALESLDAFYLEHRLCDPDSVRDQQANGVWVVGTLLDLPAVRRDTLRVSAAR